MQEIVGKPADKHAAREVEIFRAFASTCGLPVLPESVEKRDPPEPDILCHIDGEGHVAFEMVELIDERNIGRRHANQLAMMDHLREGYRNLPDDIRNELRKRLGNAIVCVGFSPEESLRKCRNAAGSIFNLLLSVDAGFEGRVAAPRRLERLASIKIYRANIEGPLFDISAGGWFDLLPLEGLQRKFENTYASTGPVELLAYFDTQVTPPDGYLMPLCTYAQQRMGGSSFRRVWFYDYSNRRVCWSGGPFS